MDERYIAIAALQHYAFCPRQFALIHVEQEWDENFYTAEGKVLHEKVDTGQAEQRGDLRYERSVSIISHQYQIMGKMDLLEIETLGDKLLRYFPVEYKRGKPKIEAWDRIQLCAQALCLEEMRNIQVTEGAIWYWEIRRREPVNIDLELRNVTLDVIKKSREILRTGVTPPPIEDKTRCRACSLNDICLPDAFIKDSSKNYINNLFTVNGL